MKILSLVLISFLVASCALFKNNPKRKISYSVANYSGKIFLKEKYQKLFDSILHDPISNYLESGIANLPTRHEGSKYGDYHVVEPLFVDLENMTGLYAYRAWPKDPNALTPRFLKGHMHYLFIISDNVYTSFDDDSTDNALLIETQLGSSFSREKITEMLMFCGYSFFWSHHTYYPPRFIVRGKDVLFDLNNL